MPPTSSSTAVSPASETSSLHPPSDSRKKKKKKHSPQEKHTETTSHESPKKRKRQEAQAAGFAPDPRDPTYSATRTVEEIASEHPTKKKAKKTRQIDTMTSVHPASEPTREESPQASTTAFLSAIVAAATGAPDASSVHLPDPTLGHDMQAQFIPSLSPLQYPFGHPNAFGQADAALNAPNSMPLSELTFGSNEDVLRAIQDLDISRITNVLKTLGEAAAAAAANVPSFGVQPAFTPAVPTALNQTPAPSHTILGRQAKGTSVNNHQRSLDAAIPPYGQHTNPDHAHLLANRWLSANKLAELVQKQGLVYKKGKFSAIEEQQLKSAIENYRIQKGLSEQQILEVIFPKNEKVKDNAFWSEITIAVPQRPIIAVYHHVRRTYHPMKQQGKWTPEEDALLKQAVVDLGQQWEKVSERVSRMSSDCRDRWRNHLVNREVRVTGPWSKEEEDELTRIVTSMTTDQGRDFDNDVFWGKVSEMMGGRRGRQQCRIKWTDALSKTVKNEGNKPRWSQQDAYILVHKIDSLNVHDDTEIDWKTIPDPHWNLWSAHTLQRRWLTMKRSIKGYEDMTHQEIMDILRVKKSHLPASGTLRKRKERKVISATTVTDADLREYSEAGSGEE
ncbi:hypothetical protein AX16_001002 [Volvariella volvacea WC 439]|nr:hypothetical protein AX16_001002 [Volvariella volvacea WC 439]